MDLTQVMAKGTYGFRRLMGSQSTIWLALDVQLGKTTLLLFSRTYKRTTRHQTARYFP